jgi:hypothetical protein
LGLSAFRILSHGDAIGRFDSLEGGTQESLLKLLALRAVGTGGPTADTSSSNGIPEAVLLNWSWFASTLLVISELDRVEVWVNLTRPGGSRKLEATSELPELTPTLAVTAATSTLQQKIIEIRFWIYSINAQSLGAPGDFDHYSAGLRAMAQAYYVVYNQVDNNFGGLGGRKSVKALRVALGDAVVNRAVCALGGVNENSFLITIDLAFDGAILKNAELKSQLLGSYHHVMRRSPKYFRSKCSMKGWRPRKGSRREVQCIQQEKQKEHEQTNASDPADTLTTLLFDGFCPQPSLYSNWGQSIDLYDQTLPDSVFVRYPGPNWCHPWDHRPYCSQLYQARQSQIPEVLAHVEQVPIGVSETIQVLCAQCGFARQSNSSDYLLLSWCDRCWCEED